jgi:membrane protease YdiL (CAAX protease family)
VTPSLIAAALWALVANIAAVLPGERGRDSAVVILVLTGVPLLGWLTFQNGPWIGLAGLAAGAATLRWPLFLVLREGWHRFRRPILHNPGPAE